MMILLLQTRGLLVRLSWTLMRPNSVITCRLLTTWKMTTPLGLVTCASLFDTVMSRSSAAPLASDPTLGRVMEFLIAMCRSVNLRTNIEIRGLRRKDLCSPLVTVVLSLLMAPLLVSIALTTGNETLFVEPMCMAWSRLGIRKMSILTRLSGLTWQLGMLTQVLVVDAALGGGSPLCLVSAVHLADCMAPAFAV